MSMGWCILIVVAVLLLGTTLCWDDTIMILVTILAIGGCALVYEPNPVDVAAQEARRVAAETPHVIREVDGCKVYEFEKEGRNHFFTRCPTQTSTDRTYTTSCGKNCSKVITETIVTENK